MAPSPRIGRLSPADAALVRILVHVLPLPARQCVVPTASGSNFVSGSKRQSLIDLQPGFAARTNPNPFSYCVAKPLHDNFVVKEHFKLKIRSGRARWEKLEPAG